MTLYAETVAVTEENYGQHPFPCKIDTIYSKGGRNVSIIICNITVIIIIIIMVEVTTVI